MFGLYEVVCVHWGENTCFTDGWLLGRDCVYVSCLLGNLGRCGMVVGLRDVVQLASACVTLRGGSCFRLWLKVCVLVVAFNWEWRFAGGVVFCDCLTVLVDQCYWSSEYVWWLS